MPSSEAGSGQSKADEEKRLSDIVAKMNDLFSGELTEADFVGYIKTMESKLLENSALVEQAGNNSEEQFRFGDFKAIFTDTVVDGINAHNSIAKQLLSDDRIFAAMQGMMASAVYKAFGMNQAVP